MLHPDRVKPRIVRGAFGVWLCSRGDDITGIAFTPADAYRGWLGYARHPRLVVSR